MRTRLFLFAFLFASFTVSSQSLAQKIQLGMPLSKLLPILAKQKSAVDTTREGKIKSFITGLEAYPFKRFTVDGRARFCIDPGPDTLEGWGWISDSMAFTDYRIIVKEIATMLGDTGEEWPPVSGMTRASHVWGPLVGRTTVNYLLSDHIYVSEGLNCLPDYDP